MIENELKEITAIEEKRNQIVYVYSTETYLKKNWYKIGMTTQVSAEVRIQQQDGTSNPEELIELYSIDISNESISAYELEQKIHALLDRGGLRVRDHREWFKVEGGIEAIKILIERILDNTDLHKKELSLKPHQISANNFMNECFSKSDKKCLLAHKPRSGKTYVTAYNIRENGYKNTVILTSYPILNIQWEDTFKESKGFSNYNIVIGSNSTLVEIDDNKNNIILLSLQDVKGGEEVFEKEKFKLIKNIQWDILVIDEIHSHVETEKTEEFLNKIKYDRLLGLSATPSKNLLCGRFDKEQIHSYTIIEETKLKKEYPELYPYADIEFHLWDLSKKEKNELVFFEAEDQFTFDKLFRIENDDFFYKNDVSYIFKKLIGDRDVCKRDKLGTLYPLKNNGMYSCVKSILLFVSSTETQYKLKELLEDMESFNDFNIHLTNSDEFNSKQLMNKVRRDFKSNSEKRSLIIAVEQLTTGITLEDCDMVIFMNDWKSLDRYIQASFRCQSPREGKNKCFVIDLNPTRSFEMIWEYQNVLSRFNDKSTTENLREWFNCVNVFNRVEGELQLINVEEFNRKYNEIILEKPRFNPNIAIYKDKLKFVENELKLIGLSGNAKSTSEKLNDDGPDSGKNEKIIEKITKSQETEETKKDNSLEKLIEMAKILLDKTMLIPIFTNFKYDNLKDCFKELDNNPELCDYIIETLLLSKDFGDVDFNLIKSIYNTIYDTDYIDRKIFNFNNKIHLLYNNMSENTECVKDNLPNVIKLIEDYLKPSSTEKKKMGEVFTPLFNVKGCVYDQLNQLDKININFWKNKYAKVLDACAGVGNYPIVLVKKFMEGLKDEIVNPEERLKWIIENIIYINEFQSKNLCIYLHIFDLLLDGKCNLNFNRGDYLTLDIKKTFNVDKFDLIVMNPPYHSSAKNMRETKSIYPDFIEKAVSESKYLIAISPSRWFINEDMKDFKNKMLNNFGLRYLNDSNDTFEKSADIKGGVSYFLIESGYKGDIFYNDVVKDFSNGIITNEDNSSLVEKMMSHTNMSALLNTGAYFGIETNDKRLTDDNTGIKCYMSVQNGRVKYLPNNITINKPNINKYKVLVLSASGSKKNIGDMGRMEVAFPNEIHSASFSHFVCDSLDECYSLISYLNTKLIRYMISLNKPTQRVKKAVFNYVPVVSLDRIWTDEDVFNHFKLTEKEIEIVLEYNKIYDK